MRKIRAVAYVTFLEGLRSKAILGIFLFGLVVLSINVLVSSMIMRDVVKVTCDIALSAHSFSLLLVVLFIQINLLAKDLERKTIYIILSKAITRGEYLAGKFLGMLLLLLTSSSIMVMFSVTSVFVVGVLNPGYAGDFTYPAFFLSSFMTTLSYVMLSSIVILISTFTSSSFVSVVMAIFVYFIGHSVDNARNLLHSLDPSSSVYNPIVENIVDVLYYVIPNFSLFDFKNVAAYGFEYSWSTVALVTLYALTYIFISMFSAILIFSRKEFP